MISCPPYEIIRYELASAFIAALLPSGGVPA
jgi:hypothetical protein